MKNMATLATVKCSLRTQNHLCTFISKAKIPLFVVVVLCHFRYAIHSQFQTGSDWFASIYISI